METRKSLAYRIAARYGLHFGLSESDAEDCATEFVEREAQRAGSEEELQRVCTASPGHVWRRAHDFAANYARAAFRRSRHEWRQAAARDVDSAVVGAEEGPLREAFWDALLPILSKLPEEPRRMFIRYHAGGETIEEIAASAGKSRDAIYVAIHRAGRRLRARLTAAGLDEAELRSYLPGPRSLHATARRQVE